MFLRRGPRYFMISIHAPREGGDALFGPMDGAKRKFQATPPARGATSDAERVDATLDISIHAPREGGDAIVSRPAVSYFAFQSTPPARGATRRS